MSTPFFVEVLARNGEVRHRHQVAALPIRLGRAYDNDFILDDLHASAHHAIVQEDADGTLLIRDVGSENGLICVKAKSGRPGARQSAMPIDGDSVFRLGHTNLRIRPSDFVVAPALRDTTHHGWEGWPPALAGLLLTVGLTLLATWFSDTEKFDALRYVAALVPMLATGALWCGLWSFANRLFGGHARFGRHLFIFGCGLAAVYLWTMVGNTLAYAFSQEFLTRYASHVGMMILAGIVFFHLLTISPRHPRRFGVMVGLFGVLAVGFLLMISYQRQGRLTDELYMSQLLPPVLRVASDKPIAQFIAEAAQLKSGIDAERLKGQDASGPDIEQEED